MFWLISHGYFSRTRFHHVLLRLLLLHLSCGFCHATWFIIAFVFITSFFFFIVHTFFFIGCIYYRYTIISFHAVSCCLCEVIHILFLCWHSSLLLGSIYCRHTTINCYSVSYFPCEVAHVLFLCSHSSASLLLFWKGLSYLIVINEMVSDANYGIVILKMWSMVSRESHYFACGSFYVIIINAIRLHTVASTINMMIWLRR